VLPAIPNGTRVTFGATGTEAIPFDGTVVFSRNGVTSTCPGGPVSWTLNRVRG